jgi:ABC-type branched-subunit amino acid transport system substrate-binding protein
VRRAGPAAAAVALLATACGTTVKGADAVDSAGSGLTAPAAGQSGTGDSGLTVGSSPGGAAGAKPGALGTTSSTATGATGAASTPTATSGSVAPQLPGLGITKTTISIGVSYSTGNDEANRALGNNLTTGDQKADAQAVIDDINTRGGVAGRKLVPVWYDYQTTDARPYTTIDNEACAHFTQDNHVFAVAGDGITENFAACVTKAGAMMVASASQIIDPDQAYFDRYPYVFNVGYLTQDRMMAEEVRSLVRQNWFTGWNSSTGNPASAVPAKIGIISFDTPSWNTPLDHVMLPALRQAGHPVDPANVERVAHPSGTNDIASSVAQIQSAVLKFRQNGVTHVIVLDGNGSMTLHMLNNMRSQHYYPRLGVNSATGMEVLATQYHEDAQSFHGAAGLGWGPILDLPAGKGDRYFTSHTQDCIRMVEKRTGQKFADTNSASVALGECDQLYLLADAINSAGSVVNRDTASAAIEALGGKFPAAGTRGVFFSPSRHDGIEFGYDISFDMSCRCAKYVSGPFRIP